jgi:hypothetical protein
MEPEEFSTKVKKLFYKTSAQKIGERTTEDLSKPKHGINGNFSKHLMNSGMWKNNGLYCRVDTDKFVDGSKDWMDKIN